MVWLTDWVPWYVSQRGEEVLLANDCLVGSEAEELRHDPGLGGEGWRGKKVYIDKTGAEYLK